MEEKTQIPCDLCLDLIRWITDSGELSEPPRQHPEWHQDTGDLQISAESCPLCSTIWHQSLSKSYSGAIAQLDDAPLNSSPQLFLEVADLKKTEGIFWATIQTKMSVSESRMIYSSIDTIGISSHAQNEGFKHPDFWRFGKVDVKKTLSEDRMATLKEWLQDCESNHKACHPVAKQYPTRILDIKDGEPVRIVAGHQIQRDNEDPIRYATLSHSWGSHGGMASTTSKTKHIYEKRIDEKLFPQTFQDAIVMTRSLGIRYLWIDSLCIVQDDPKNWQTEALEMANYYSGSTINIAASDAQATSDGCFGQHIGDVPEAETKRPRVFVFQHFQHKDQPLSTMVWFQAGTPRQLQSNTHLSTRGWVLQEELLSNRIVHCMKPEIHWQCRCCYRTQAGQVFDNLELFRDEVDFKLAPSWKKERTWYQWMEDYSMRDFTFPSDRIAAMAGITGSYQERTGHSPMLGLWKESLAEGLSWLRIGQAKESGLANMPSWTWLSYNAPVIFDFWGRSFKDACKTEDHVFLCACNISWDGLERVSSVQSTSLTIRGHLQDLRIRVVPGARFNPPYFHLAGEILDMSKPIPWSCCGQFDDKTITREDFATYTCLLVRSCSREQSESRVDTFLILEPVASSSVETTKGLPIFRRIGIASIRGKEMGFLSGEETELNLC